MDVFHFFRGEVHNRKRLLARMARKDEPIGSIDIHEIEFARSTRDSYWSLRS